MANVLTYIAERYAQARRRGLHPDFGDIEDYRQEYYERQEERYDKERMEVEKEVEQDYLELNS